MATYRVTVRKDLTFDIQAPSEEFARAATLLKADGTGGAAIDRCLSFVAKTLTVVSVEQITDAR